MDAFVSCVFNIDKFLFSHLHSYVMRIIIPKCQLKRIKIRTREDLDRTHEE